MSGYGKTYLPISGCVHFVRALTEDEDLAHAVGEIRRRGIACAYVDAARLLPADADLCNAVAQALGLENSPYQDASNWTAFWDDLGRLSRTTVTGVLVVVDRADRLMLERPNDFFALIEAFLSALQWWLRDQKPLHLCLQLVRDLRVSAYFEAGNVVSKH